MKKSHSSLEVIQYVSKLFVGVVSKSRVILQESKKLLDFKS